MALGKHATQSSTRLDADASKAVDGNLDARFFDGGSCTHTLEGASSAWWRVDLGREVVVSQVMPRSNCSGFIPRAPPETSLLLWFPVFLLLYFYLVLL